VTRAAAIKSCMVNPSAQSFIVPQGFSYPQAEEAGVGIHETWCDAPIAPVPMDQNQFTLAHLPGLLHKFHEDAIPYDLPRVIAVKIDLHAEPSDLPISMVPVIFMTYFSHASGTVFSLKPLGRHHLDGRGLGS
jgi:hypothetical protein